LVAYLESIADRGRQLAQQRWADAWTRLDALLVKWPLTPTSCAADAAATADVTDDTDTDVDATDADTGTDEDDDDDDDGCDGEATEIAASELPSRRFLKAISRENTSYCF
jgi:hypothetical protein